MQPGNQRSENLDIEMDMTYQRREWKIQRIGWWVLGFIVLLSLAGVFGSGPLAKANQSLNNGSISYEKFQRVDSPSEMEFRIHLDRRENYYFWIGNLMREYFKIENIFPEPDQIAADRNGHRFIFKNHSPQNHSSIIKFSLAPSKPGKVKIPVSVESETSFLSFTIYP